MAASSVSTIASSDSVLQRIDQRRSAAASMARRNAGSTSGTAFHCGDFDDDVERGTMGHSLVLSAAARVRALARS